MSRATAARSVDFEPIDRLEEKVKMLVSMIARLKADQARAAEENARLARELESARVRIADSEAGLAEIAALRTERESIRGRVSDLLDQLEGLRLELEWHPCLNLKSCRSRFVDSAIPSRAISMRSMSTVLRRTSMKRFGRRQKRPRTATRCG